MFRDLYNALSAVAEKLLGHIDLFASDIVADRKSGFFFEDTGQITLGQMNQRRQISHRNSLVDMGVNIVHALADRR